MSRHRLLIIACLLVALAYVGKDIRVVVAFWFHGIDAWTVLFRPFPEWGEGAELYGALLPAKWIGTRTMWYAAALLAVLFFSLLFQTYKLVAIFLFEGALIELQQGSKRVKAIDIGKAERGRKNEGSGPAYRSRFTAVFAYESFDPNAVSVFVVNLQDGKEIRIPADFSKVK